MKQNLVKRLQLSLEDGLCFRVRSSSHHPVIITVIVYHFCRDSYCCGSPWKRVLMLTDRCFTLGRHPKVPVVSPAPRVPSSLPLYPRVSDSSHPIREEEAKAQRCEGPRSWPRAGKQNWNATPDPDLWTPVPGLHPCIALRGCCRTGLWG